eukprot:5033997-Alexandrium_andersonii.AAC.1
MSASLVGSEMCIRDRELIRQSRVSADGEKKPGLTMDDPTPFGRYLGCDHITGEKVSPITGKCVRILEYVMSEFMEQCVE